MKKIKLIALVAALVVALGVYLFLKEIGKPQETPRTAVIVAAVDIPENTKITAEMIVTQEVATEALLPSHIIDPQKVVGMVVSSDIYAGEQIVSNRLVRVGAEVDESKTLAYKVDDGMRAVTISVNGVTGLAGMIRPGNRVDLIISYTYDREVEEDTDADLDAAEISASDKGSEPETESVQASRLLLQNVQVLAVGSVLSRDGTEDYATVTLQLSPEDAVTLSYAEFTCSIRLILRSALDNEITDVFEADLDTLRGKGEEETAS